MKPFALFIPCLLLGLSLSGQVSAETSNAQPAPNNRPTSDHAIPAYAAQARKAIDAVLAEPAFARTKIVKVPELKEKPAASKEKSFLEAFIEWLLKPSRDRPQNKPRRDLLPDGGQSIAQFGQIVLWLLAFGLVVLLAGSSRHWLPFFGWHRSRASASPPFQQSDSALEIAVALPEDIATAAERCWREGKKGEALSLLYRGVIELLTARHRIDLPQGATEEEMRLLVSNAMPSFKNDFANIARAWLCLAYAHRPPAEIAELLAGFSRLQQAGGGAS